MSARCIYIYKLYMCNRYIVVYIFANSEIKLAPGIPVLFSVLCYIERKKF
jgi:hypothetical protein